LGVPGPLRGVAGYRPVFISQVVPAARRQCLNPVCAATVKILNEIISSGCSSGTHICRIVSGSFVFSSYSVLPGTPLYGKYSDRTVTADLMETHRVLCPDLDVFEAVWTTHPSRRTATCIQTWFVMYKDNRAIYDLRSYELNSTQPSVCGHPRRRRRLSLLFLIRSTPPTHARLPGVTLSLLTEIGHPSVVGEDLQKLGRRWAR